jgi:hypothetical protein
LTLAVLIALVSVYSIVPVSRAGPLVDCNNNTIPDNCDLSCGPAAPQGVRAGTCKGQFETLQCSKQKENESMTTINGHYDGKRVVLDQPVPGDIPPQTPVKVVFEPESGKHVLARIAELAISTDELPPDYSEQHEHYAKGTPRR